MLKHGETPVNFLRPPQIVFALEHGVFPDDFVPQQVKDGPEDITDISLTNNAWGAVSNLRFPLEVAGVTIRNRREAMRHLSPIIQAAAALAIGTEHQV